MVVKVFPHPVIPRLFGVITEEGAFTIWDDEVEEASDTWYDADNAEFLVVVINDDGTWSYDDGLTFECFDRWDEEKGDYAPSKFLPGTTVYPVLFHPNVPGGWTVCDATGEVKEYWQCASSDQE